MTGLRKIGHQRLELVITSYSIHYTKLYDTVRPGWLSQKRANSSAGQPTSSRITSYNVCYTKLLRLRLDDARFHCLVTVSLRKMSMPKNNRRNKELMTCCDFLQSIRIRATGVAVAH